MGTRLRWSHAVLAVVTVTIAALGLVPEPYHRWWWWDWLMHLVVASLLAVWGRTLRVPPEAAWPAFVVAMLAWEWVELWTPLLFSPSQYDLLVDLSVNALAFWSVWTALTPHGDAEDVREHGPVPRIGS